MTKQEKQRILSIIDWLIRKLKENKLSYPAGELMHHLEDYFAKDPKFDRQAFWAACGL